MALTEQKEGEVWKLAAATLGTSRLKMIVSDLQRSHVTPKVDILGILWRESVGAEALEALRSGLGQCESMDEILEHFVALSEGLREHLLYGIVQSLPVDQLPADLIEWRLQLDLGI